MNRYLLCLLPLVLQQFAVGQLPYASLQVSKQIQYQGRVATGTGGAWSGTEGYFSFALVQGATVLWNNWEGTASPSDPGAVSLGAGQVLTLPVSQGVFSIRLGEGSDTNEQIPATVFFDAVANSVRTGVKLAVWFSPSGSPPFTRLIPDVEFTSVPYAMVAGISEAVKERAVTTEMLADGSVNATKFANGAAAANLAGSGQSAVPSGGMILSASSNDALLLNSSYTKLGKVDFGDVWEQNGSVGAPPARDSHTVVWTGGEMIVWGGRGNGGNLNGGARYDSSTNTWTTISTIGAPTARYGHSAIWTGSEMVVWGGYDDQFNYLNTGGRYNPTTNTWTAVATTGAPTPRTAHSAVWSGNEMIIWGGEGNDGFTSGFLNTGGRYNPVSNTWTAVTTTGAPEARSLHSAVWSGNGIGGSQMIVWAGTGAGRALFTTGSRYNPVSNSWSAMTNTGAPSGRTQQTAIWSGTEMIIWGGSNINGALSDGARYYPAGNSWTTMTAIGAPLARVDPSSVWTGSEMIVWGGYTDTGVIGSSIWFNGGGRYNPTSNTWVPVTTIGAPVGRNLHTAAWTGSDMIIWAGYGSNGLQTNGVFTYTPVRTGYLYRRQ